MPPSPAMRCSPRMEVRAEQHKRGRSLESGILFKEKEDDLALFSEVQKQERDNFLLQSKDDFEDLFSKKIRNLSEYKLGITIPVRGESSDLLNADGEKNDYDWLLTPPDTPLFPSLDDDAPPVNLAQRGRPRSQPITISRSSTMEKSYRSSRGSASPNRLSPSPRSGNSVLPSRGRPSSAPISSPTLKYTTPARRVSPPPSKPSTSVPRSSTPTPHRVSTGSSSTGNVASSQVRGTSPMKASRGNSMSPKIQAWQSNFSGFSLEAPPNLRTSLAERPASYVRGSSPVSRNGRGVSPASTERPASYVRGSSPVSRNGRGVSPASGNGKGTSSRSGRQSLSPSASRSINSSHSHDHERLSTYSKASVASSGDDDVDSFSSIAVIGSDGSASRSVSTFANKRNLASSKKPSRIVSSSSAPKRSFDLAMRQMDHRKGPQNMFRPLLSSVPSSTFYVGKSNAANRPMISRNSSVTTSSNASSEQGTSAAQDTEGSDFNHEDVTSRFDGVRDTEVQDEVFLFDKADALKEDFELEICEKSPGSLCRECDVEPTGSSLDDSINLSRNSNYLEKMAASEGMHVKAHVSDDVDAFKDMVFCSRCGHEYHDTETMDVDLKLCPDCRRSAINLSDSTPDSATVRAENLSHVPVLILEENQLNDGLGPTNAIPKFSEVNSTGHSEKSDHEVFDKKIQHPSYQPYTNSSSEGSFLAQVDDERENRPANNEVSGQPAVISRNYDGDGSLEKQHFSEQSNIKACASEGAGISVLLKRSGSVKGPVFQSRTFTAATVPYDDLSYMRDSTNSVRSSLGHGSGSASSSVDVVCVRQMESHVQRQLSGRKPDIECYKGEISTEYQRAGSVIAGNSSHTFQVSDLLTSTRDQSLELPGGSMENGVAPSDGLLVSLITEVGDICDSVEIKNNCTIKVASTSGLPGQTPSLILEEQKSLYANGEKLMTTTRSFDVQEAVMSTESPPVDEEGMQDSLVDRGDIADSPTPGSSDNILMLETENDHLGSCLQSDIQSPNSKNIIDDLQEPFRSTASDNDTTLVTGCCDSSDHKHVIPEESTVLVGEQGGAKARSLTLDEATDTILYCRAMVEGLAYEAATTAMEKEVLVPLEGLRPAVTVLGRMSSDRKQANSRTLRKRVVKPQRGKQRPVETESEPPQNSTEVEEKADASATQIVGAPPNKGDDSLKPPKLESKCNCTIM